MSIRLTRKGILTVLISMFIVLAVSAGGYIAWRVNTDPNLGATNSSAGGDGKPTGCYCSASDPNCSTFCSVCNNFEPKQACNCKADTNGDGKGDGAECVQAGVRWHCCDGTWAYGKTGNDACGKKNYGQCDKPTQVCWCKSWAGCGVDCTFPAGTQGIVNNKVKGTCKDLMAFCVLDSNGNTKITYGPKGNCNPDVCHNPYAKDDCTPGACQKACGTGCPTGTKCDTTTKKCVNPQCPTDADCKCPIVTPTPPVYSCNSACTTNAQCQTANANYQCASGKCRNKSCTDKADCTCTATPFSCNSTCTTDAQCETADAGYRCVSGQCRNNSCSSAADCLCNSNWSMNKSATVVCINDNTADVASRVTYTISVTYNSNGADGTIGTIVDTFTNSPIGVQASWISNISAGGVVFDDSTGVGVTWTLTGADATFTAGQTKTFTFIMTVPGQPYDQETAESPQFGIYTNVVTVNNVVPAPTNDLTITRDVLVGCRVPYTGIFDSSISKIILALIFIVVGYIYFASERVESLLLVLYNKIGSTEEMYSKSGRIRATRSRFEKRMTKKK